MSPQAYALALADGTRCRFTATPEAAPWLADLAAIMRLAPAEPEPSAADDSACCRLAFSAGTAVPPADGRDWHEILDGHPLTLWSDAPGRNFHCALDPIFLAHPDMRYLYMACAIIPLLLRAVRQGGLPIHGALATHHGQGVIIAARGATGKSTCMRRLPRDRGWRPLGDDLALLLPGPDGRILAHPLPTWSDPMIRRIHNTWPVATAVPVVALCFLEQAPVDAAPPLPAIEATLRLFAAAKEGWPMGTIPPCVQERYPDMLAHAGRFARHLPGFHLQATLDGAFWEPLEAHLQP